MQKTTDRLYSFTEAAIAAGIENVTTFTGRWWPKIVEAHEGLNCPAIRSKMGTTPSGNPRWRVTAFGVDAAIAYRNALEAASSSQAGYRDYCKAIATQWPHEAEKAEESGPRGDSRPEGLGVEALDVELMPEPRGTGRGAIALYQRAIVDISEDLGSDYGAAIAAMDVHQTTQDELFQAECKAAIARGLQKATVIYHLEQTAFTGRLEDLQTHKAELASGKSGGGHGGHG